MTIERLIFVYNVDASPLALLRDLYKGIRTGRTDCHLCDVRYGRLLKDRSWNRFVNGLPFDVRFRLKSTFVSAHPEFSGHVFPAAFVKEHDKVRLRELISANEINAVANVDDLRALVSARINQENEQNNKNETQKSFSGIRKSVSKTS